MRYRRLGRTGWKASEIGFGAWGIGKQMWIGADDRESLQALHQAVDRGLNFVDTALAYGDGHETLAESELVPAHLWSYIALKACPGQPA